MDDKNPLERFKEVWDKIIENFKSILEIIFGVFDMFEDGVED